MKHNERKFPRVPVRKKARLALRRSDSFPREGMLLDVSAEGVAIRLSSEDTPPVRGETITVSLHTGNAWVDIPGRVSYALELGGEIVVGVRLYVEVSGSRTRLAWSRWVDRLVGLTQPQTALRTTA